MSEKPPESRRADPFRRQPPVIDATARDLTAKPAQPEAKPAQLEAKPAQPTVKPAQPTVRPAQPETKPAQSVAGPVQGATGPAQGGSRPAEASRPAEVGKPATEKSAIGAMPSRDAAAGPAPRAPAEPPAKPPQPAAKATVPPSPAASAAAAKSGIGSLLGSAVLGGVVGAALAVGVERMMGPLPNPLLDSRLTALEQRPAGPPAPVDAALAARVTALESAQKGAPAPDRTQIDAMAGRIKALEDTAGRTAAAAPGNAGAIDDLRRQLGTLSTRIDDTAKQAGAGAQASATALAELTARVTALGGQAAQQSQAQTSALAAMQARLGDVDKRLGTVDSAFAKYGPDTAQAGLRVVVAQRLDTALRAGQPLGSTVATLGRLGASAAVTDALKPYVETAAPSTATLLDEFRPLGERMVDAARGPASSFGDRLQRMAERVVTVRRVGESGGSDVPDIVASIEAALGRGDAAAAAAAWDRLPDSVKPISADWATRLKGRAAASAAASRLQADSLGAIDAALR